MKGADVFIGLSVPGILSVRQLRLMARDPIVFAMANPDPEIQPEEAQKHVRVMATGRSDYPNQINNVLCFPGFFRGLLDSRARTVNDEMKLAAARALAACVGKGQLSEEYIIPSVFNKSVAPAVAAGVARAAQATGVARRGARLRSVQGPVTRLHRAARCREIEPFLAVEIGERAQALERAGADVVHLEFGEPDFEAPAAVREAAEKALKDGRTKYVSSLGILPLREAIAAHYRRTYGVVLSPDQILVTPGTSPAMLLLFGLLLDPGDEVILSDPYYACYPNFIRYAGGIPAYVPIAEADGFQCDPEAIARRRGPRTKAILINSPANPTGAVLTPGRLAAIAAPGRGRRPRRRVRRDLSRAELRWPRSLHPRIHRARLRAQWLLESLRHDRLAAGLRHRPREHVRALQTLYGNFFIATNEFVQWAGVAALTEAEEESRRYRALFDDRRRAMIAGLRAIGLGVGFEPMGAFYVLANARRYTADSTRFALDLLESCHVAVTPGAAFGPGAEGYLRFSYASSVDRIREGLRRVGAFLAART